MADTMLYVIRHDARDIRQHDLWLVWPVVLLDSLGLRLLYARLKGPSALDQAASNNLCS